MEGFIWKIIQNDSNYHRAPQMTMAMAMEQRRHAWPYRVEAAIDTVVVDPGDFFFASGLTADPDRPNATFGCLRDSPCSL